MLESGELLLSYILSFLIVFLRRAHRSEKVRGAQRSWAKILNSLEHAWPRLDCIIFLAHLGIVVRAPLPGSQSHLGRRGEWVRGARVLGPGRAGGWVCSSALLRDCLIPAVMRVDLTFLYQ